MKKREKKSGVRCDAGPAGFISFALSFSLVAFFGGPVYPLAAGGALLIHELAHFAAAKALGAPLSAVSVGAWGIRTEYDYSAVGALPEIAVLLAGPAANLAVSLAAIPTRLPAYRGGMFFILSGFALAAVNLLPVTGLDGGAALYAAVGAFALPDRASAICSRVSLAFTFLFWGVSAAVMMTRGINYSLLVLSAYFLVRSLRC